jgi:hypothetical protein
MIFKNIIKALSGIVLLGLVVFICIALGHKIKPPSYEFFQNTGATFKDSQRISENNDNYGDLFSKEKAAFEKKIATLLSVASDDTFRFGWGQESKMDMSERSKSFTPEAWNQYKLFIDSQRDELNKEYTANPMAALPEDIKKSAVSPLNPYYYIFRLEGGTQEYEYKNAGKVKFSVKGERRRHYYDTSTLPKEFVLNLVISGDFEKQQNFVIENWQFNLLKPEAIYNGR